MTIIEDLPWMILVAAIGVAAVLIGSYVLILKRPLLEARLRSNESALGPGSGKGPVEETTNKLTTTRQRASNKFLLFSLEYLTDRKNIAVHAVLFPSMLILVIFSLGMPFHLRAIIVLTVIGCNVIRMRVEKRRLYATNFNS